MTTQSTSVALPNQISPDPIIAAMEFFSSMAYDDIQPGEKDYAAFQIALKQVTDAGWERICTGDETETNTDFHYQGIAFYNATTKQAVIANRGSQTKYDFLVSDTAIAIGKDPKADGSALAFYSSVTKWLGDNGHNDATVIETGHSLGGQEADYVTARVDDD